MTAIAIEEHRNLPEPTSAVRATPRVHRQRVAGLERKVSEYVRSDVHIASSGMLNPTAFPTGEDRERFTAGTARALFAVTS